MPSAPFAQEVGEYHRGSRAQARTDQRHRLRRLQRTERHPFGPSRLHEQRLGRAFGDESRRPRPQPTDGTSCRRRRHASHERERTSIEPIDIVQQHEQCLVSRDRLRPDGARVGPRRELTRIAGSTILELPAHSLGTGDRLPGRLGRGGKPHEQPAAEFARRAARRTRERDDLNVGERAPGPERAQQRALADAGSALEQHQGAIAGREQPAFEPHPLATASHDQFGLDAGPQRGP